MDAYILIPIIEVLFCVGLLILLIVNGLRHVARRPFTFFLGSMTLWGVFIFMMRSSSTLEDAYFWELWVFFAILSAALFFYRFTISLTGMKEPKKILYSVYALYAVSMILVPTGLVVSGMQMMWYGKAPIIGPAFFLYVLTVYLPIIFGLRILIRHYRQSRALNERVRDSYIMVGIIVMLIGGTTDFLPSLGLSLYPLGIIGNILFCVLATIAMLRYGLLEIKVVLRRGTAYSLVSFFMLGLFAGVILIISNLFKDLSSPLFITIAVLAFFIIAAAYQPLQSRVQKLVDRVFYGERYDHLQALEHFTRETKDIVDLKRLSSSLLSMIARGMGSRGVYLLLPSVKSGDFVTYAHYGKKDGKLAFPANSLITQALRYQDGLIDVHDIDIIPSLSAISDGDKQMLEYDEAELLVPLKSKEQLTGILVLSSKVSGETYSTEDRRLLSTVANQAAISIENARLYEELKEQLVRSSKLASLGELAANVAHEVNNSLQSVINFGTLLYEDLKEDDIKREDAKAIESEALRARNIVETLLGIARKERTEMQAVDVNELLHSVVTLAQVRAKSGNIDIIEKYSRETPLIHGSAEQLRQVFLNLFTNAADAIPDKGKIEVETALQGNHVVITVADTGTGIPSDLLDKIFDPLFTTKGNGTGLGLTVSLSIVQEHGGTIDVESENNKGTKFIITLPKLE